MSQHVPDLPLMDCGALEEIQLVSLLALRSVEAPPPMGGGGSVEGRT